MCYTDESKNQNSYTRYVFPINELKFHYRILDYASIFTAEIFHCILQTSERPKIEESKNRILSHLLSGFRLSKMSSITIPFQKMYTLIHFLSTILITEIQFMYIFSRTNSLSQEMKKLIS